MCLIGQIRLQAPRRRGGTPFNRHRGGLGAAGLYDKPPYVEAFQFPVESLLSPGVHRWWWLILTWRRPICECQVENGALLVGYRVRLRGQWSVWRAGPAATHRRDGFSERPTAQLKLR